MRIHSTALAALFVGGLASAQASYTDIPNSFYAMDVTPDGEVVVGTLWSGGAFYWRWRTDPDPIDIGGKDAVAISDDGSVILGNIDEPGTGYDVAGLWTESTGWVSLGYLPTALSCPSRSTGYDLSGDGTTAVGLSWDGCSGRGFRWNAVEGMVELEPLANGGNRASAIAANGSAIVGFAQGSFNRTPAQWNPVDDSGEVIDVTFLGEYLNASDNGDTLMGTLDNNAGTAGYEAFYANNAEGFQFLGQLNSGWSGNAIDRSENGEIVLGYDNQATALQAWIWNADDGIVDLQSYLTSEGVAGVPALGAVTSMTPDGKVIVGHTFFQGAFIIELPDPEDCGFRNYGAGAAPANILDLDPIGDASLGAAFSLVTSNVPLTSPVVATVVSLGDSSFPGLGGQILIDPFTIVGTPLISIPAGGSSTLPLAVLSNPAFVGTELFFQSLAPDTTQPDEWALSNGVELDICP